MKVKCVYIEELREVWHYVMPDTLEEIEKCRDCLIKSTDDPDDNVYTDMGLSSRWIRFMNLISIS